MDYREEKIEKYKTQFGGYRQFQEMKSSYVGGGRRREREREKGRRTEGEGGREVYRYIVMYHIKTFGSMTDDIRNGCPIKL